MADLKGFKAGNVPPLQDFQPVPPGKYPALITNSEEKLTRSGSGKYLELTFQILEGEHKGRLLWARLNLDNPSSRAVEIARKHLAAICRAVNILEPADSTELHNIPLLITVKIQKDPEGESQNRIVGYALIESRPPEPPQVENATPPWRR